jgi:hypothetical protein
MAPGRKARSGRHDKSISRPFAALTGGTEGTEKRREQQKKIEPRRARRWHGPSVPYKGVPLPSFLLIGLRHSLIITSWRKFRGRTTRYSSG